MFRWYEFNFNVKSCQSYQEEHKRKYHPRFVSIININTIIISSEDIMKIFASSDPRGDPIATRSHYKFPYLI